MNFYNKTLSFLNDFKYYDKYFNTDVYESFKYEVQNLKLFPTNNYFSCDYLLKGDYKGINVTIGNIHLKYKERKLIAFLSGISETDVFDGIILCFDSKKIFTSTTVVRVDCGTIFNKFRSIKGLETVRLEDPVFEKKFEVYSSDQIGARYLLTTAFMERLLKVRKKLKVPVFCSFENGCVYIAVKSNFKTWSLNDINSLLYVNQNISVDLEMIFSIIDTLHANESIGM